MNTVMHERYLEILKKIEESACENAITAEIIKDAIKKRPDNIYKNKCGSLLICGGSPGLTGAPIMAANAALRCGAGLVTVGCSGDLNAIFEVKLTEAMTLPLHSDNGVITYNAWERINSRLQTSDAFLLGPGISVTDDIIRLAAETVTECHVPLIIDADGLNALSNNTYILRKAGAPVIVTPHIGEFARMIGKDSEYVIKNKENLALDFSTDYKCVVVLKSHETIVTTPDGKLYKNVLGNPGMATGGTGDVLAGCISSFVSQGCDISLAALAGVYLHSLAADIAVYETGEYSLLPTDIINCLKYAINESSN